MRFVVLVCLAFLGCSTTGVGPRCVEPYRRLAGTRHSTEFYRMAGAPIGGDELGRILGATPMSTRDVARSRALWIAGWVVFAAENAAAVTGLALSVAGSDRELGRGLLIGSSVALLPTLAAFFGSSRALFHRAIDRYNQAALDARSCPLP